MDWATGGHVPTEDGQKNRSTSTNYERNYPSNTSDKNVYVGKIIRQCCRQNSQV